MTIDEAKDYIREHATDYLQKATKSGYICPICNSGAGKSGTGIETKDNIHYTCFAHSCFSNADVIDIIGIQHGIDTDNAHFIERLQKACDIFNISLEQGKPAATGRKQNESKTRAKTEVKQMQEQPQTDYTEYYKQCNKDVTLTDYWQKRGIGTDTIQRFMLGYDIQHNAIVIPITKYAYKTRRTDTKQFYNSKGGAMVLFNPAAINNDVVYICESETDALSVEELGKPAIAIRGANNTKLLYDLLQKQTNNKALLLCLDIDEAGDKATNDILADMEQLGVICYDTRTMFAQYKKTDNEPVKDINDMLMYNRPQLADILQRAEQRAIELLDEKRQQYINANSTTQYINEFINGVKESVNTPPIATGYSNLDEYLDGGLYEGLYTIGAITSLGKTTFILQMADYIAEHGKDVLIFSLEMSHTELLSKSFARNTYKYCIDNGIDINPYAKSSRNITNGALYPHYKAEEIHIIKKAINKYAEYSNHIYIYENDYKRYNHTLSVADVEQIAAEHKRNTGNNPVIIIDYLQLLAPPQERLTDKQAVDQTILRLKDISRKYKTPVIAISSFNRTNYRTPATFESFKESGGIEYTSNVTLALQLKGVETTKETTNGQFNIEEAKTKNPREIELKILKNRAGQTGGKLQFNYYPQFDYFREV